MAGDVVESTARDAQRPASSDALVASIQAYRLTRGVWSECSRGPRGFSDRPLSMAVAALVVLLYENRTCLNDCLEPVVNILYPSDHI